MAVVYGFRDRRRVHYDQARGQQEPIGFKNPRKRRKEEPASIDRSRIRPFAIDAVAKARRRSVRIVSCLVSVSADILPAQSCITFSFRSCVMNYVLKVLVPMLLPFAIVVLAQPAAADTVTFLGVDDTAITGAGPGYVGGMARLSVVKAGSSYNAVYDPNKDGVYGSNGYYVYNNSSSGPLSLLPSYVSSVSVSRSTYSSYSPFDDPSTTPGSSPSTMHGIWFTQNNPQGVYIDFFTIKLAQDADFVLTTLLDTHIVGGLAQNLDAFAAVAEKVTGPTSTDTAVNLLSYASDGISLCKPIYTFFEIKGHVNDQFTVALLTSSGDTQVQTQFGAAESSGVAFETVPEPSTLALLGSGFVGLLAYAWRRQR